MLTTNIALAGKYDYLSEKFKRAVAFLRETDLAALPDGMIKIDGDDIYMPVYRVIRHWNRKIALLKAI